MITEDMKIKLPENKKKIVDKILRIIIYSVSILTILSFIYFLIWGAK